MYVYRIKNIGNSFSAFHCAPIFLAALATWGKWSSGIRELDSWTPPAGRSMDRAVGQAQQVAADSDSAGDDGIDGAADTGSEEEHNSDAAS